MIGLRQTQRGGPDAPPEERGDCLRACLCSVLEVPIDAIGNFHGTDWWESYERACRRLGAELHYMGEALAPFPGYWIAAVPSLNLPAPIQHAVVMRGEHLAWDPSTARRYEHLHWTEAQDQMILVAHDPARGTAERECCCA